MQNREDRKMNKKYTGKIVILVVLVAVFALFAMQQKGTQSVPAPIAPPTAPAVEETTPALPSPVQNINKNEKVLPRLLDLGSKSCVPCKMMAPILEELQKEYKGKLQVEIIDVWEDQSAGDQYRIRVIPTQIFLDPSGKELFRHIGFISKEDILAKWKELGFNLTAAL